MRNWKKRMAALFASILVFSLTSVQAFAEPFEIESVSVTVTEPEVGENPSFVAEVPEDAHYETVYVWWNDGNYRLLSSDDKFEENKEYSVNVLLKEKGNHPFSDEVVSGENATINGHTLDAGNAYTEGTGTVYYSLYNFLSDSKYLTLVYHFNKLLPLEGGDENDPIVDDGEGDEGGDPDPGVITDVTPNDVTTNDETKEDVTDNDQESEFVNPPTPASEPSGPAPEPVAPTPAPEESPVEEAPLVEELVPVEPLETPVLAPVAKAVAPEEQSFDIVPFEGSEEVVASLTDSIEASFMEKFGEDASYDDVEFEIFEVTLMVPDKNGELVPASVENFPEGGKLTVTLPYPEGTNKDDYSFVVSHMFTTDFFGKVPGDIETPDVRLTEDGVEFDVTGLSPIALGWLKIFDGSPRPKVVVTTITPDAEALDISEEAAPLAPGVSSKSFWAIVATVGTLAFAAFVYIIIDKQREGRPQN